MASSIWRRVLRQADRHPVEGPSLPAIVTDLRQQSIDTAVFITRHLDHFAPGHGAACDGGQDADTAQELRPQAPAPRSVAALRSAGTNQRRLPPARRSPRRKRGDPTDDLTKPRRENNRPPAR